MDEIDKSFHFEHKNVAPTPTPIPKLCFHYVSKKTMISIIIYWACFKFMFINKCHFLKSHANVSSVDLLLSSILSWIVWNMVAISIWWLSRWKLWMQFWLSRCISGAEFLPFNLSVKRVTYANAEFLGPFCLSCVC